MKITIKEENFDDKDQDHMELKHPLRVSPKAIMTMPRSYRWTMTPKGHDEVHWWINKLKINYAQKTIRMVVYYDAEGKVFEWIQSVIADPTEHELLLKHLDAGKAAIDILRFSGLKIECHRGDYDYSKSTALAHQLKLSYKHVCRFDPKIN